MTAAALPLEAHDPRQIGPYRLLGRLGAGGMGRVFLAEGPRAVLAAVKVVHVGLAEDDRFRARFRREVDLARRVVGPWTAPVLAADADAPEPWLATEYVAAPTLDAAVRAVGPLPSGSVELLAAGLARALATVHQADLVHRDVKPSNVLLAADRPRLIDFGISRAVDGTRMTSTGTTVGTPAFMSPEHAAGEPAGPGSDVFALGAVLVMAATGIGPFGGGPPLVVLRRILTESPDLGALEEPLRSLVARCLSRDVVDRPTAVELADRLPFAAPGGGWLPPAVGAMAPPPPIHPEPATRLVEGAAPTAEATVTAALPAPQPNRTRPRLLTRRTVLAGLGALAVVGGGAYWATTPRPTLLWTFTAPQRIRTLVAGTGTVYTGADDASVHALDAVTGQLRWTYRLDAAADRLGAAGGVVHANSPSNGAVALDAESGTLLGEDLFSTVLVATEKILIMHDDRSGRLGGDIVGREPRTGERLWQRPKSDFSAEYTGSMAGASTDGRVHLVLGHVLVTLDAATGEPLWSQPLGSESTAQARIAAAGATVYVEDPGNGRVVAADAKSGSRRWEHLYTAANDRQLVVDADSLYVTETPVGAPDGGTVSATDALTGSPRWSWTAGDGRATSPALAGDCLYVGTGSTGSGGAAYTVHALSADSGGLRWSLGLDEGFPPLPVTPVAAADTVFVATDASVLAVRA